MGSAPFIGITAGIDPRDEANCVLRWDCVRSIEAAGGVTVILAPRIALSQRQVLDRLDGVLFSGGSDLDPALYGAAPSPHLRRTSPERDRFEVELAAEAIRREVPVLGICRGAQVLNVVLGGDLIQDIPTEIGTTISHDDLQRVRPELAHQVTVEPGSRLRDLLGCCRVDVNSFHHQAPRRLGDTLRATAWADDGVVEAVEQPNHPFLIGLQWHPESFWGAGDRFGPLFAAFVASARERGAG